jgi:hypothetical protein
MSTLKVDTITKADGTGSLSVPAESGTVVTTASPSLGRRNLIINGAMQVAQRGTSVTGITSSGYQSLDRWKLETVGEETLTMEQSSDAPDGFGSSMKITVTTADSDVEASDWCRVIQCIEGQNFQSLAFGTSGAQQFTLSFWVKSSVTGTYAVTMQNTDADVVNVKNYTINSANTWEYKTVTYEADTSNSIDNDNQLSMRPFFFLTAGSDRTTDDNAVDTWTASNTANNAYGHTADIIGTASATWYITGVQLEVGTVATPFEHRSYGEELALCQRYYQRYGGASGTILDGGYGTSANATYVGKIIPVTMRAAPTITKNGTWSSANATISFVYISNNYFTLTATHSSTAYWFHHANSTDDYLELNAEL